MGAGWTVWWWPRRRPPRRDVLSAAAGAGIGLLLFAIGLYSRQHAHPTWLMLSGSAIVVGAQLLRGVAPLGALVIGLAGLGVDAALGGSTAPWLVFTDLLYAACVYGPRSAARWLTRLSVLAVLGAALAMIMAVRHSGSTLSMLQDAAVVGLLVAMVTVLPVSTGALVRHHRDEAESHRRHADQVARLAELDHRRAVADERRRMARELHDLVANHLSAIAVQSTGALSVPGMATGGAREVLTVIRENSVQGLAEMRRMIGLLRDADGEDGAGDETVTPTMAGIPGLVTGAERSGLRAALRTLGTPRPVPAAVGLAGYRIVQESLTNALKHARPGPAEVTVEYRTDDLVLTVTNALPAGPPGGSTPGDTVPGAGAGLVGMRERAALLGGTLTAGRDDGTPAGWRVRATLPATPMAIREGES